MRFARVPTGEETCGWCFMLASRGFAYTSSDRAGRASHQGCDCKIVPGTPGTKIEGYDPDLLLKQWRSCVETVDNECLDIRARAIWDRMSDAQRAKYRSSVSSEVKEFLASIDHETLKKYGLSQTDMEERAFARFRAERLRSEAFQEVETRTSAWLYRNVVEEPTFVDEAHKLRIERESPHEIKTAVKLARHGISPKFRIDEYHYIDERGIELTKGLADLACNVELKTIITASTRNTINGYLKNASSKEQCDAVVFDNSGNEALADSQLIDILMSCRSFRRGRVYVLTHDESLMKVR